MAVLPRCFPKGRGVKFTKPAIAALTLPEGETDRIWFDDAMPGFGVRFRKGGRKVWIVQYRFAGRQRRYTIGRLDSLELAKAREAAHMALSKVGLGRDPQGEKVRAKVDAAVTFGAVVDRYLVAAAKRLRPRSYAEAARHLKVSWVSLAKMSIRAIDRATIADRLATMATTRGTTAADHARTHLSALFTWAMREGLTDANPVLFTNRPATARKRDRVLTDAELLEVWRATVNGTPYSNIVRLLMLTGQRRDEVGSMAWVELDLSARDWLIPGERTKNHRAHIVPLSDAALEIIRATPRIEGQEFLFSANGYSGWSKSKAALDAAILAARRKSDPRAKEIPAWRLHDLRRTFSTRGNDLGIAPHVIEAALNHVSGSKAGVAGNYNFAVYANEKRAAMAIWSDHVLSLAGRSPVVTALRKGAA